MIDFSKVNFWNTPNRAGVPSFTYAELLAQVAADFQAQGLTGNPNLGLGVSVEAPSGQSIPASSDTPIDWENAFYDDNNFSDTGGANPERLTIPDLDPPIQRVIVGGWINWAVTGAASTIRGISFRLNNNLIDQGQENHAAVTVVPGPGNRLLASSGPVPVVAGDFFTISAFHNTSPPSNVSITATGWLYVVK